MVDSIVSVRMPSSLVQRLKLLSKENHFLDVSEEIRSIIRIKTVQYRGKAGEVKDARKAHAAAAGAQRPQAGKQHDFRTENVVREELVKRLKDMIKELEHEN